jgi:2,4-diketo-3-deoxy-L-fuconate hydrolase
MNKMADRITPSYREAELDRRAAIGLIGSAIVSGCAAPALARSAGEVDRSTIRFALATRATADGPRSMIKVGDSFHDLHDAAEAHGFSAVIGDVTSIIHDWEARRQGLFALARALRSSPRDTIMDPVLAAPFKPHRIFAAAANFLDHAAEMKTKLTPKAESEPYLFLKTVESVVGPEATVIVPPQVMRPDWEVELGVVLGRSGKNVAVDAVRDLIAGYTIVNDVSARDRLRRSDYPFAYDWFRGKSFDSFTPLGPIFVPRDCLGDPNKLRLGMKINDVVMQDGNTSDMIFNVHEMIAYLSGVTELRAGDLILSGTPAGVGMGRGVFLKDGDVMTAWVDGIGELVNPVSAPHLPQKD